MANILVTDSNENPRPGRALRAGETGRIKVPTNAYVGIIALGSSNTAALVIKSANISSSVLNPDPSVEVTAGSVTTITTVTVTASTPSPIKSSKSVTVTIYPPPKIIKAEMTPSKSSYFKGETANLVVTLDYADPIGGTKVAVERPKWNFWGTSSHYWPNYWAAGVTPMDDAVGGPADIRKATVGMNSNVASIPVTMQWWEKPASQAGYELLGGHDTLSTQVWKATAHVMKWWQSSVQIPEYYPGEMQATWVVSRPLLVASVSAVSDLPRVNVAQLTVVVTTSSPSATPIPNARVCVGSATNAVAYGKKTVDAVGKATFSVPIGVVAKVAVSAGDYEDASASLSMPSTSQTISLALKGNALAASAACL